MYKSNSLILFLLFTVLSCNNNNDKTIGIDIPMPDKNELPIPNYLEETLFLGWKQNDYSVFYYLKEFTGYESDYYTIKLLSQNASNDKVNVVREFTSFYGDENGFSYLEEFLEKRNAELKVLLEELEISLYDAYLETETKLRKGDQEWSFKVNNQNVGDTERYSTKVVVNKPDGTFKSILNHRRNKSKLYTDMQYLGHILNPSNDNVVVLTYAKSEAPEGASLYTPIYIGCSLNDINGTKVSSNALMKNGKKLIKESEIRGLLIGKWYLDAENIIGEPDEIYRSAPNSSRVYYNAVLDNYNGSVKHMCVFVVDNYVKDIFTCTPGKNLQINGINYISTSD